MSNETDASASPQPQGPPTLPVAYYNSTLGMPTRAALTLRGHAAPCGDTGDWPLDDTRVGYFEETVRLRKRISSAASLYKSLMALIAIGLAVVLPVMIFSVASGGGRRNPFLVTTPIVGVMVGFGVLYYFAYRATRKSQRWAPLTMFIIFILSGIFQIVTTAITASVSNTSAPIPMLIVVLLFSFGFAVISWRAVAAIPAYLAQPAWCQELVVKSGI